MENEIYEFLKGFYFEETNMKELLGTKIIPVNRKCVINNKHFIRYKNDTDNVLINIESVTSRTGSVYTFNNLSLSIQSGDNTDICINNEIKLEWLNGYSNTQSEYYIKDITLSFDCDENTGEFIINVKTIDNNEKEICSGYIKGYLGFENLSQTISISYNYNTKNYYLEDVDFEKWKEELWFSKG